jgi:glycerol-3-phosphate dehydrogenase subunit C
MDDREDKGAPTRHPIGWSEPEYTDAEALDAELRRVFDICHGCRRCFNLCDSFPSLFNLIDESKTGELDSVESKDFALVADACTLCDMCFTTTCPYVPPHEFDLDFPHLMLRAKAVSLAAGEVGLKARELRKTDRNGRAGTAMSGVANWATKRGNALTRSAMQVVAGVHRNADLPPFANETLVARAQRTAPPVDTSAPAHGRKAVLYATCYGNFNRTQIGVATRAVLARNGVETEVTYFGCCGMPQLETGDVAAVAASAKEIASDLCAWVDKGYDVIALTPSCALMLKFEWPLIVPEDANVARLSAATSDVAEYVIAIARKEGLAPGLRSLDGAVALHLACHARAQNMGPKASDLLDLIPGASVTVIERCSGHGGAWGVEAAHFETALKVGKPVARRVKESGAAWVASECPLAAAHIVQGIEELAPGTKAPPAVHPIELFARAYGISEDES